jgi:predicted Zn-dependent peptidase
MERLDVDGVPVFWRQGPEPLSATLLFRVGRRDETFVGGGVTHLVEHLVMREFGRTHLDCNASVDLGTTLFTATGRPEAVKDFLESVCRSLRDLPVQGLEIEKSVLKREGGSAAHPLECAALVARFGGRDLGLSALVEPALDAITADDVRAWAGRYFVTENAAIALTGPPPTGLTLDLQSGVRNRRTPPAPRPIPLPGWVNGPPGVAVALLGTHSSALKAGMRVALDRITDELRHGRGEAYDVDFYLTIVDAATELSHVTFVTDPEDKRAASVANQMVDILVKLADDGPTLEELGHDHAGMVEVFADPRSIDTEVCSSASAHLADKPLESNEQLLEEHLRLTPSDVAHALAPVRETILAIVPEEVEFARPRFRQVPPSCGDPVDGRVHKRRPFGSWAPPGTRLRVGDQGVSIVYDDGVHGTARWADVDGVGVDGEGVYSVQSSEGTCVPLRAGDWLRGGDIIKVLQAKVPAELFFREDSDDGDTPEEG